MVRALDLDGSFRGGGFISNDGIHGLRSSGEIDERCGGGSGLAIVSTGSCLYSCTEDGREMESFSS